MSEPSQNRGFWWYWNDRAGRAEYWTWIAVLFAVSLILGSIPAVSIGLAFGLLLAQIRRAHDFGRSGWWAFAAQLVPTAIGIGAFLVTRSEDVALFTGVPIQLVLIVLVGVIRGQPDTNRFGPPPTFTVRRVLTGR